MENVKKATALSLFAGIGGFEVGMSKCGFTFLKTLEIDEKCCITLNLNKHLTGSVEDEIHPIDITQMLPENFWHTEVDYIVGGPPCQSFSAAGRRAGGVAGTNDTRGTLFWYYCQYVKHFKPKAFVFENVRGILSSRKGEDFKIICASFEEVGYHLYWRVLNAADYGVPQSRERVFLVGIRKDINVEFRFPLPTHGPDSLDKKPYVTVYEAIKDIYDENEVVPPYGGKYGHLLPDIPPGENYRYYTEEMGHPEPLFAWRSKFSNFLYKMDPNDVCRTIIAYQGRYDGPFHWKNRKCTIDELKLLQGFPIEFVIPHSYTEGVKQIGNSVCPPVAYQIGCALRYQVEGLADFEVPLIAPDQKLSFDKRKSVRAKKSRAKKKTQYSDLKQISIFDLSSTNNHEYPKFTKIHIIDGKPVKWDFKDGNLEISFGEKTKVLPGTIITLTFFGSVTSNIKSVSAKSYCSYKDGLEVKYLWSEIHRAISELTTYDSLLPLYGHFTEPYPKFEIKFQTSSDSQVAFFQKLALEDSMLTKIQPYSVISNDTGFVERLLKTMRKFGYDVRTNYTNNTIPERHFRICYPFTMPQDLKSNITWVDGK
jgi:DNA (cytosine-5)-methyltransferase 1